MKVFYKLIVPLWVCIAWHVHRYLEQVYNIFAMKKVKENVKDEVDFLPADIRQMFQNKFAISLQYLKKEVSDEDKHFLHADKHESLLQIDTMILMGIVRHCQSSQNSKFAMSLQYLKKEVRDEVDF